jgi:general secretion pathway protein G
MAANRSGKQRAFTLIELMVVLVILAVLATAILPNVIGKSERAKRVKAQADIAVIEGLLDQLYLDLDRYPTSDEGLRVLYYPLPEEEKRWKGPYSKKPITNDPWGNPYVYESPGTHSPLPYEVMSYGNDGIEGGEDDAADIVSWPEEESEI